MRLEDHCTMHEDEIANKLVLRQPNDGRVRRERQKTNYIDVLLQDTRVTNAAELFDITGKTVFKMWCNLAVDQGKLSKVDYFS